MIHGLSVLDYPSFASSCGCGTTYNVSTFVVTEQLRLQDMEIRRALKTKQELVADILHVPQDEFRNIADMAGEPGVDKEASELVLAAISQGWFMLTFSVIWCLKNASIQKAGVQFT